MGEGLKRVAAQCGGLRVEARGGRVTYDKDGKIIKTEKQVNGAWITLNCGQYRYHAYVGEPSDRFCARCGKQRGKRNVQT